MWLFTRPGFETEGGQEMLDRAGAAGISGFFKPFTGSGLVSFQSADGSLDPARLESIAAASLVFVRDIVFEIRRLDALPASDRTGALMEALGEPPAEPPWGELLIHTPPGSQDRDLSRFARKWTASVSTTLRKRGWLIRERDHDAPRLDLVLLDFERLVVAESHPGIRAEFPGGRLRIRLPVDAPSRSVLKLEEALLTMMTDAERERLLKPGMRAVDLGAAPGGWSFCLARRGLRVTAVDNGPMDRSLIQGEQVEHLQADGFTWLPGKQQDWMVCDIVDKPRRTVELVGRWFAGAYCRASVFNLKLPMKRRLEEWVLCRERLEKTLAGTDGLFEIRAKHLYHDREEITVMVLPARDGRR
jgi:23S rRNA (cytidine2498-2'-O)-methyltransferase